ncbi:hypothetical protein Pla52nx_000897 [Stieleria varia]|uniref:hypothetical protein n=1 Tax=Stieleria varia TaxID=2528005 RepID=UPI00313C227C
MSPYHAVINKFCRRSVRWSHRINLINESNELDDLGADNLTLISAKRSLADLLRGRFSTRSFDAIGSRVTVRLRHSTSATSSAGQNQERNPRLDLH